jgi:outer membrane receptor protein involved in Fe transport
VLGLYADVDATAGNYLDPTNLTPVAARLLLGAGVYASLPDGFRLRLSGRNLADTRTNDFANYPLPGRELYVTLAWSSAKTPAKE